MRLGHCPYCNTIIDLDSSTCPNPKCGKFLRSERYIRDLRTWPTLPTISAPIMLVFGLFTGKRAKSLICGLMAMLFVYCIFGILASFGDYFDPYLFLRIVVVILLVISTLFLISVYIPSVKLPTIITKLSSPLFLSQFIAGLVVKYL